MKNWGLTLIVIGLGSFILPIVGIQFSLISLFGEENQTLVGLGIAGLGAILYAVGSIRERLSPDQAPFAPPAGEEARATPAAQQKESVASRTVGREPTAGTAQLRCSACGTPAPPGDRFCRACGATLAVPQAEPRCPACGAPAPPGDRFCRACGAGLTASGGA